MMFLTKKFALFVVTTLILIVFNIFVCVVGSMAGTLSVNSTLKIKYKPIFVSAGSYKSIDGSSDAEDERITKLAPPGLKVEVYNNLPSQKLKVGELVTDASGSIKGAFNVTSFDTFNISFKIIMETSLARVIIPSLGIDQITVYETPITNDVISFDQDIIIEYKTVTRDATAIALLRDIYDMERWFKQKLPGLYNGITQVTVVQDHVNTRARTRPALVFFLEQRMTLGFADYFTRELIYHEYAHAVMNELYARFPFMKTFDADHFYDQLSASPEDAFAEGWGAFMESAVSNNKSFLSKTGPILSCVDNAPTDKETNDWWKAIPVVEDIRQCDQFIALNDFGEKVEGAVASILWDIYDGADGVQDLDADGLSDGFQPVWHVIEKYHPHTFKGFWDGYMDTIVDPNRRQAFRKISEQNGIVYSRARFSLMFQWGDFLQDILTDIFGGSEAVKEIVDNEVALSRITGVSKDNLHVQETEPIQNVVIKYRKRKTGEEPTKDAIDPENLNLEFWKETAWNTATATVQSIPLLGFLAKWDVSQDVAKEGNGEGFYDLLVQAFDENGTYDTFYPRQDDDTTKTVETMKWLRDLGTLTTVKIKPAHVLATTPLDGTVGVPVTQQLVLAAFHKPMDGASFRVARAPSPFMFAMGDSQTLTDASAFLDNPSVIVREKCTGRRIRVLEAKYIEDKPSKKFELELKMHDDEAGPEEGAKHLKDGTLYEVTIVSQEVKDIHGIHLDGNGDGIVQAEGDDYSFSFFTGNIYPYLQAVELKQDEVKVCDKTPAAKESKVRYKAHWELVCGADGNIKNEFKLDVGDQTVGRGLLQIKLSFPKSMNPGSLQAYLDFHGDGFDNPNDTSLIAPQQGAGATRISSDSGTWSQSNHVWNATFNIPAHDPNFEDKLNDTLTRLVVYAEDTEGNKLDSNPETLNVLPTPENPETAPAEEEVYTVITDATTIPYTTTVLKPVDKKHRFETQILPQLARLELQKDGAPLLYTDDALCQLKSGALKPQVDEDSPVRLQFSEKLFKKKGSTFHDALTNHFKIEEWGTLVTKTKAHTMTEEEIKQTCDIDEAHPERGGNVAPGAGKCTGWLDLKIQTQFGIPPGELNWVAGNMPVNGKEITQVALDYSAYRSLDATPRLFRYDREYRVTVKTPSKNEDGTLNADGLKDLNGLPLDGDKDEEMDGVSPALSTVTPSEDTFTFIFKTPKPKGEHTARPPANIPPPSTGFNKFLSFLVFGGDFCKMKLPEHKLFVKNLNRREEYMESGVVDFKVDSPVDPKTKEALCEWSSAVCKSTRNALENGLIPVPSDPEKELEWGKLNIFPWDSCGSMTHTLVPSVTESRIQGREEGGCLSADDFGNCLAFGTTLPMEVEAGTLDKYPVGAFTETPAPAGDGKPDESESVATNMSTATWDVTHPEMLVAANGFYKDTGGLLERFSVKKFPMDIEGIAPKLLEIGQKVVVLPSASLSGYDTSALIKTQFADFVRQGGILVSFTQQRGFDYTVLPGGEVSAAGYLEDISCYTAGSEINQYHPIMAGQTDTVFDGGIDGYFLSWPSNAKILLRRKKNNFPALLVYPYGQGFVVASTLYTDFAGSSGQLTYDETQLLKDLLVWLKNPKDEFAETKPGQQMTLTVQLHNGTTQDANGAKITVRDTMNQVVSEKTAFIGVPAGQTVPYDFSFTAPSLLGNYTVSYALLFDAQTVQSQTFADTFSVTEHLQSTTPDPQLQFSVTAPGDLFPLNSPITFTVHVKNNGDTERTLSLSYLSHPSSGPIGTVTVPAHGAATLSYTTPRVYFYTPRIVDANRWDFYLNVKNEQGNDLISGHDPAYYVQGLAYIPSVTSSMTLDKKSYAPSAAGAAAVKLINTTAGPFNTGLSFSILNPNNQKIYETTKTGIAFSANETKTEVIPFTLPASLVPGPYTVQASITRDGAEIGKATNYFTVEKAKIAITPVLPGNIVPSSSNAVSFKLTNTGQLAVNSGQFTLTAKDTEGTSFFTETQPFTLNVAEQKTLSFNIPFPALQFGTYKLSYTATTETGIILGSTSLNALPLFTLTPDKPSFKAGDTAQLSLKVTNPDIFTMNFPVTLSAPSVSFTQTQTVSLGAKEQKTFAFSMPVTNTANAGTNALSLTASIAKPYTQAFSFFVQPAKFSASLDKLEYQLNETGNVAVTNTGGLDASASYTLTLTDKDGIIVENSTGTLSLPVMASANIPVVFTKPEILSGMYRLSVLLKDTRSSVKFPFEQYVTFTGVSATVSVSPTKTVYTSTEVPTMKTKVTPTGNLQNTKLTVKILNPNPKISAYAQVGASASILVDPPYIWFGTMYHGAKRLEKSTNSITDILPNTYIYALAADNAYVYLGTEAALYRYDKTSGALSNFPVTNIRAFSRDGSFLWIGTDKGVRKWDTLNEIVTESYTTQNGLPENPIWTLLSDGNRVYIATFNKGLFMLDKLGKTLTQVTGLPDLRVRGMAIDTDALWMATWNGVVKLNRKTQEVMQTFNTAQGLADKFTYSIVVDGNWLWVGTLSGLSKYDKSDNTWKTYTKADGMSSDYVRSLAVDAENVYLGCFMK